MFNKCLYTYIQILCTRDPVDSGPPLSLRSALWCSIPLLAPDVEGVTEDGEVPLPIATQGTMETEWKSYIFPKDNVDALSHRSHTLSNELVRRNPSDAARPRIEWALGACIGSLFTLMQHTRHDRALGGRGFQDLESM